LDFSGAWWAVKQLRGGGMDVVEDMVKLRIQGASGEASPSGRGSPQPSSDGLTVTFVGQSRTGAADEQNGQSTVQGLGLELQARQAVEVEMMRLMQSVQGRAMGPVTES